MDSIAYKIVEFWYITEFLNQEVFPADTKANAKNVDIVKKMELNNNEKEKIKWISKFILFHKFPGELEISEMLKNDTELYKDYPLWSNDLHLCVGRVKKESLVCSLYKCLGLVDDRPEIEKGEICLIALKVDEDGIYVEKSFQLSPLVWGIYQSSILDGNLSEILTKENYDKEVELTEQKINKTNPLQKKDIKNLYLFVVNKYVKPIQGNIIESNFEGSFIYTRYNNEETFKNEDDKTDNVSNLTKGFYTNDLAMIKESFKHSSQGKGMTSDLQDYVISAWQNKNQKQRENTRINIRDDKQYIEKWLYVDKAPQGKWPSKFKPALMQQIAINISTSKDTKMKNIFSVNGPPGTGKTTLLKEIIASTIVERAKFLCRYEKADDAFKECHFEQGKYINREYDKFCNKYYTFENETLSDFSMIVASCNNAAVENITKELPDGNALLGGLKVNGNDKSSEELANVAELFDIIKSNEKLRYKNFDKAEKKYVYEEKNDVYFSWSAYKLKYPKGKDDEYLCANEWGLISAPMGKTSNIKKYCNNVLDPIIDSFYYKNDIIINRNERYECIKKKFKKQLIKIEQMEKELNNVSRLSEKYRAYETTNKNSILKKENNIKDIEKEIAKHIKKQQILNKKILDAQNNRDSARKIRYKFIDILKQADKNLQNLQQKMENIQKKLVEKEDKRKWFEILFGRWINTERLRQIVELKKQIIVINDVLNKARKNRTVVNDKYNEIDMTEYENLIAKLLVIGKHEKELVNSLYKNIREEKNQIDSIRAVIIKQKKECQEKLHNYSENRCVIDSEFWNEFDNELTNTNIQSSNPWFTEEYNREREKLFYLALQVHKEFVLSSRACRDNFKNLLFMWKCRKNSQDELCTYSQNDKDKSYSHLLNTLFLLTPVMSTTFASVEKFLGNIKQQGRLGLLIIDEAGQAAPQVALGALWRCKKAIVVGDPKQVEPVVTADADAIKHGLADADISPYISKTLSVQEFADNINTYGAVINNPLADDADDTWVGCPLVVHRRCVNPMFEISNQISYGKTMKLQTAEAKEEKQFVMPKSCWINVSGKENGNKNHFILEQGKQVLDIIINSFRKYNGFPDLYVISPFTTVISGIRNMVKQSDELKIYKSDIEKWINENCGTVHKFQGKEAKEVIFLLGCDERADGAVNWVKPNIVNVAVTRAKYRFYIIGDYEVWKKSKVFMITKNIIDKYNLEHNVSA